jgi:MarR family transcriptional regulator, negative regulator of the multidrug operon emrRAB
MERTTHLDPRHQVFLDAIHQMPGAETDSAETYWLFLQLARKALANQQAFYDRYELSEGKLVVLLLLRQAPHFRLTPSALAQAAGVTRGTMTGLLAGLQRCGLVKRTEHPEDGRMLSIELTQAAFDRFEQMLPERFQQIVECMSSLTQEEQHQLRALLQKIERGLAAQGTS